MHNRVGGKRKLSSYFHFPTSHTTVRAVRHTAVPILDAIRDTPPLNYYRLIIMFCPSCNFIDVLHYYGVC